MFTSLFTLSSQIHSHTLSPISQWGWFLFSLLLSLSCFSNFSHPLLLSPFLPPFLSTLFIFHHHPLPLLPYSFLPPPPRPHYWTNLQLAEWLDPRLPRKPWVLFQKRRWIYQEEAKCCPNKYRNKSLLCGPIKMPWSHTAFTIKDSYV